MPVRSYQILPLLPKVQLQIRSSIDIALLSYIVIELVKNLLDAQPCTIYIEVDYLRGGYCIENDGAGIHTKDLSEHRHFGSIYCK